MFCQKINLGRVALSLAIVFGAVVLNSFPGTDERTAIVCFLEGKAKLVDPGVKESRDLQLFDWLRAGAAIETSDETRMVVAFANGDRYELRGKVKATLKKNGFASASGTLVELSTVSCMPQIVSLAAESKPGSGLTGIRLRGTKRELAGLYPSQGSAALADETVLRFTPLEGVEKYRVQLGDEWGNKLLSVETISSEVTVSPGILKPGARYLWRVLTLDKTRPSTAADAEFFTLSAEQAKIHNAFRSQVLESKDAAQLLLLAQLESVLNLRKEACTTLREAQGLVPQNAEIKKAIERMGCKPPR